jgi:predicted RNA-binding Zn ribbon-like protein
VDDQLFIEFANSEWYDGRGNLEDRFRDPAWRREFLDRWNLTPARSLDEAAVRALIGLRSAIRSIVERLRLGRLPAERDLGRINAALAAYPVRFRLSVNGRASELGIASSAARDVRSIAGEIALSTARFLAEGEIDRLKMCDNDGCRWVFHDDTKNRSRRWCGPCGNVDKVRRFRERQRSGLQSGLT